MAKSKKVIIGDDYQLACDEFLKIADKTGDNIKTIISRKRYAVAHLQEWLQNM
jgi:hypothetical protein